MPIIKIGDDDLGIDHSLICSLSQQILIRRLYELSSGLWGWGYRKEQGELGGVGRTPSGELVPCYEAFGFDTTSAATSLPGGNHRISAAVIAA